MIMALVNKYHLGFLHNPGGGQFTNPALGIDIQVHAYGDDEDDYRMLVAGLKKLGFEPDAD